MELENLHYLDNNGVQKPDVGEILIDDTNIEQIKQEHLNKNFVSVTQDPVFEVQYVKIY